MTTLTSAASGAHSGSLETRIRWPLRAWMVVEVGFGLLSIGSVFLNPGNTAQDFAWPIKPVVMAALLGAYYFSAALIFVLPLFARSWQQVRAMILPTAVFSLAMDIATVQVEISYDLVQKKLPLIAGIACGWLQDASLDLPY